MTACETSSPGSQHSRQVQRGGRVSPPALFFSRNSLMAKISPLPSICQNHGCKKARRYRSRFCSLECLFWARIDRSGGPDACWLWMGLVNPVSGYGNVSSRIVGGRRTSAHRHAYRLTHGDPGKLSVLHRCDRRLCSNPAHLFLGTHRDNWQDAIDKGRPMAAAPGERNYNAKLSDALVRLIRRTGGSRTLARRLGVSRSTIQEVLARRAWRHVPDDPPGDDEGLSKVSDLKSQPASVAKTSA